jgi:phosphoglycolate phosphatase-like HAD superfamily hydrolase
MKAIILSERALADTDDLFAAAVAHVVRKLGRVKPLDPGTLPQARSQMLPALELWAGSDVDTWRLELARFYEDHIPVHLRPDPALNAALRRLQTAGIRLACWSAGPDELARIVVHHLGLGRRIERIGVGESAEVAVLLADELAPSRDQALVVADDAASLAYVLEQGVGAAAALWTGAGTTVTPPVAALATPSDLVKLVLGETVAAR